MADERKIENARRGHRVYRQQFRPGRGDLLQFRHSTVAAVRRFVLTLVTRLYLGERRTVKRFLIFRLWCFR